MSRRIVIPILADMHTGSSVALGPQAGWQTENGSYTPSNTSRKIREIWERGWSKIAADRKRSQLMVVHNGDAVDGNHHSTPQLWTSLPEEQSRAHCDLMDEGLKTAKFDTKQGDKIIYVSGTETHVGIGHQQENAIAYDLDAVPFIKPTSKTSRDGVYVHPHLSMERDNCRIDVSHHGPNPGGRNWTRGNSMMAELRTIYYDSLQSGVKLPKHWIFVWAHNHVFHSEIKRFGDCTMEAIALPSFQGVTHFANRVIKGPKFSHIGMVWIIIEDGHMRWESDVEKIQQESVMKI